MNQDRLSVLLAAPPSRGRESLCFLLNSVLGIEVAALADDGAALSRGVAEQRPALVLLDGDLVGEGAGDVLARLAGDRRRCIVLANSTRQRREALAAGASGALLKGYTAMELWALLDRLGTEREREGQETLHQA